MKIFKSFTLISALIVTSGMLAACEDQSASVTPSDQSVTNQTASSDGSQTSEKVQWVWPGTPEQAVAIDPMLTKANYMIVFDGSGSMAETACGGSNNKHVEAQQAVKAFVGAIPEDANVGFYAFDTNTDGVRVGLSTDNKSQIITSIDAVSPGGGTPLKSAVRAGYDALTLQGQKQLGYGRYALVIVTDGAASSGEDPSKLVNAIINDTPVEIHTVGFCLGAEHSLNQPGRTFYASATSAAEVLKSLEGVLAEASTADVTDFSN